jgi:hypothetical protein
MTLIKRPVFYKILSECQVNETIFHFNESEKTSAISPYALNRDIESGTVPTPTYVVGAKAAALSGSIAGLLSLAFSQGSTEVVSVIINHLIQDHFESFSACTLHQQALIDEALPALLGNASDLVNQEISKVVTQTIFDLYEAASSSNVTDCVPGKQALMNLYSADTCTALQILQPSFSFTNFTIDLPTVAYSAIPPAAFVYPALVPVATQMTRDAITHLEKHGKIGSGKAKALKWGIFLLSLAGTAALLALYLKSEEESITSHVSDVASENQDTFLAYYETLQSQLAGLANQVTAYLPSYMDTLKTQLMDQFFSNGVPTSIPMSLCPESCSPVDAFKLFQSAQDLKPPAINHGLNISTSEIKDFEDALRSCARESQNFDSPINGPATPYLMVGLLTLFLHLVTFLFSGAITRLTGCIGRSRTRSGDDTFHLMAEMETVTDQTPPDSPRKEKDAKDPKHL